MKKKYICLIIITLITLSSIWILSFKKRNMASYKISLTKELSNNQNCINIDNDIVNIFYEDEDYKYYYYCMKSYEYKIRYKNNTYSLSDAIDENLVSIDNLDDIGLNYYVISKNSFIENNPIIEDNIDDDSTNVNTSISQDRNEINNSNSIKIIDRSNGECLQVIDYFYEDEDYKYFFNCYKSGSIYIIINDHEYLLKEALNNNIITINDLEKNGIKLNKEAKYQTS